ncbi:polymorphic toxin-type HINT domain-containing protein [Amycolatopsis oliviviridis]
MFSRRGSSARKKSLPSRSLLVVTVLALLAGVIGPAARNETPGSADAAERLAQAMALSPKQKTGSASGHDDDQGTPNAVGPKSLQSKFPEVGGGTETVLGNQVRVEKGPSEVKGFDKATSRELPEKRTAKERTYANTDGTQTTEFSREDVNYRTADGKFQPIDTTIVPNGRKPGWRNAGDNVGVEFAPSAAKDPVVNVIVDQHRQFGYAVDGVADSAGSVSGSTITYPSVRPESDLRLDVFPGGVKETLVLKSPDAPHSWIFPLKLTGLKPAIVDGRVSLSDDNGHEVAQIPPGVMNDANQDPASGDFATSNGVTYRLIEHKGRPALQVDLDSAWLRDPARQYPVEVDPSVDTGKANNSMVVQNGSRGDGGSELKAGTTGSIKAASYLAFDGVQDRLRNHKIFGAYLSLANSWSWSCQPRPLSVHPVVAPWGSSGGFPGPAVGPALTDSSFAHGYVGRGQSRSSCPAAYELINLGVPGRDLVQRWVTGAQANYGLSVRASETDPFGWKKFAGHRTVNPPVLYVTHSIYDAEYRVDSGVIDPPVTKIQDGKIKITVTNRGAETWTGPTYALGYRAFKTNGQPVASVEAATLAGDVPRGASVTLEAKIKAIDPGDYILDFSMLRRGGAWFTDEQIPPIRLMMRVIDVPPVVKAQYPPNGYSAPTLTPQLWVDAVDVDAPNTNGLKYRFEICENYRQNPDGSLTGVSCTDSGYVDKRTWTVPKNALRWSKDYQWRAFAFDGNSESQKLPPSHLLTAVPQPEITSHLANAPYSGGPTDFDPQTGNYYSSAVDATVRVTGPELSVARTYNSLDPRRDLMFGAGWSTRYDMRVVPDDDGSGNVVVTYSDGQQIRFGRNADGTYAAPEGRQMDFHAEVEAAGGGWMLVDRSATVYRFRPDGRLITVHDQNGRYIELDYGTVDHLKRVISRTSDRILYFKWTGNHVTSVSTDPIDGKQLTWNYTYDGDKLTKVCDPYGGCTGYEQTSGSHYRSSVVDSRPASYWRLGETAGADANSQVQTKLGKDKGTYKDVGLGQPGPLANAGDTAASFNGTSSVITLPDGTVKKNRDLAIELWFKTTQGGPLFGYQKARIDETPQGAVPVLYVGTDGKLRGQFWNGAAGPITTSAPVNDDQWHHVVLSGSLATQTLYLDGQKVGTAAGEIQHDDITFNQIGAAYTVPPSSWPGWGTQPRRFFSGLIDEVAFYEYPLGQTAALSHFQAKAGADYLSKITLPSGRVAAKLSYDVGADRLSEFTDRNGGNWKLVSPVVTGTATNLVRTTQVTDPGNRLHFYDYDPARGRILRSVAPLGQGIRAEDRLDNVGKPVPEPTPGCPPTGGFCGGPVNGGSTWVGGPVVGLGVRTYDYDEKGFQTTISDELGDQVVLTNDARGNVTARKSCRVAPGDCQTSYYSYYYNPNDVTDARNDKILSSRDARSADANDSRFATTYTYTEGWSRGLLATQTTPDGAVVRHVYTDGTEAAVGGGNVPSGLIEKTTDPRGGEITYSYYKNGDLAELVNAAGLTTKYTYDMLGRKKTETQVSEANPNGVTTTFTYDLLSRQATATSPGSNDPVTGVTHTAQRKTDYDADGNTTRDEVLDLTGGDPSRVTSTAYDGFGRPSEVTDAEGGKQFFGYDGFGNRTWMVDPIGNKYEYAYTARNAIAEVRLRGWHGGTIEAGTGEGDGEGDGSPTASLTLKSFAYDFAGRLIRETDAVGRTTRYQYYTDDKLRKKIATDVADPDNPSGPKTNVTLSELTYDAAGNVVQEVRQGGGTTTYEYDSTGRRTAQTHDPEGLANRSEFRYSLAGDLTAVTHTGRSSNSSRIDAGRVEGTEYGYDTAGRKISESVLNGGSQKLTTTRKFDQRGLITSVTDPRGNVSGADPAAFTTNLGYNSAGLATTVTGPAVDVESGGAPATRSRPQTLTGFNTFGEPTAKRDANGHVSTVTYDRLGRATDSSSADYRKPGETTTAKAVSRTQYDAAGKVIASTDPKGAVTRFRYDQLGRLLERVDPRADAGDQDGGVWKYSYTNAGDRLSVTDPNGSRQETTYDDLGRPITATQLERYPQPAAYTTKLRYDAAGNLKSTTSPSGEITRFGYDALGQRINATDPANVVTQFGYDLAGNRVRTSDGTGNTRYTSLDGAGRPTGSFDLDPGERILRKSSASYDAAGNRLSTTDPYGHTVKFGYDAQGRMTRQEEQVSATDSIVTGFGYDAAGQRTRITDGRANATIQTYNSLGLPESAIEPVTAAHPEPKDRTWTTGYDLNGQATNLLAPGGVTRVREFDALGRLTGETGGGASEPTTERKRSFDLASRLTSVDSPGGAKVFTYNDRGGLLTSTGPTTGVSTYEYDDSGRLAKRVDTAGTSSFTYDKGRLATQTDGLTGVRQAIGYDAGGRVGTIDYGAGRVRTLGYDDFGRMSSDTLKAADNSTLAGVAYGYDLDDRLTTKNTSGPEGSRSNVYGYDFAGRMTSWTASGEKTEYSWDKSGNRTKSGDKTATFDERNRQLTDGATTFAWSPRGTLTSRTDASGSVQSGFDAFDRAVKEGTNTFGYDGLDRMSVRNGQTFGYDGTSLDLITDGTAKFARGTGGQLLGQRSSAGVSQVAVTDQHGDVVAGLDPAGGLSGSTTFDPFGKKLGSTGSTSTLGYQSDYTDPDSGNVDMGARWYSPGTGTFTARDDIALPSNPSVASNRYTYGNAASMNGIDPDGHSWFECLVSPFFCGVVAPKLRDWFGPPAPPAQLGLSSGGIRVNGSYLDDVSGGNWAPNAPGEPSGLGPGKGTGKKGSGIGRGPGKATGTPGRGGTPVPVIDHRAAAQQAAKNNPLPVPKAVAQPVYGGGGAIAPVSPSPHLPAIAVGGSAAADNNVNKITNAVTGDGPIVQSVNQLPPSELGGASKSNNSGGFPSISDVLDTILPPGSLAGMLWQLGKSDSPSEFGHGVLDILGNIPVLGEVADLWNAAWYADDGDALNAGISMAAAIPFLGWGAAAAKAGKTGLKNIGELTAGVPPSVTRNALEPHEFAQAQAITGFRGGNLVGNTTKKFPGIDGWLDGAPVSLKQYTGDKPAGVLRHASKAEESARKAGYRDVDLYVEAKNVDLSRMIDFAKGGPLRDMPRQGTIKSIYIETANGWLVLPG